jgi:iron(III) transport system substrate-binding protein
MKRWRLFAAGVGALSVIILFSRLASADPLADLVGAAKKEGVIDVYAPSTLTPQGAQALSEAFNKKHGLNITLNYHPSGGMTRDVGKVVSLAAAGQPPEWDVMLVHDAGHSTLWLRKVHEPFDYRKLGIDPQVINFDNGTVVVANQFALPAYNSKIVPPQDVPKKWEDLLDPKWKDGKLGMTSATHHLARLVTAWGEEKTTGYVKALAAQKPSLGRMAEIYTRLQLGEIVIAITHLDEFIHRAKLTGAPIAFAEEVQPVISPAINAGVLKGAPHRNAGHLFAAFLTTPEAQIIWEKYQGQTSAFVPGTTSYKYAQGKKVLFMSQDQAEMVDRLTRTYGKILGFGR